MKHIFIFWIVVGLLIAIGAGINNANTVTWGIGTVASFLAMGMLIALPFTLIYGFATHFFGGKKRNR